MTPTLKDLIRRRLDESDFPEALPPAEEFANLQKPEVQSKFPQLNDAVLAALETATRALRDSDVGKKLAERALDMKPQEVLDLAGEVARMPEMQRVAALARQSDVFASDTLGDGTIIKEIIAKYAPQSLVVNFSGMADFGFGGTAYIGFAFDLDEFDRVAIFIGGSVGVGVDAIFAIGQGVGLSANAYSDMTGACLGADIGAAFLGGALLDGSLGLSVPFVPIRTHLKLSQWTGLVYLIEGIGAGFEVYGGFTLQIINRSLPDIVQPTAAHSTTVSSITCYNTQDSTGNDELYFEVTIDDKPGKIYRYPLWDYFSIDEGGTWDIGFTINFDSSFKLTLFNSETAGANTIYTFNVTSSGIPSKGGSTTLVYDNDSGGVFHNRVHYGVALYTPPSV